MLLQFWRTREGSLSFSFSVSGQYADRTMLFVSYRCAFYLFKKKNERLLNILQQVIEHL